MAEWRSWGFWIGPICTAVYVVFLLFGVPYLIYQSVHDGFTKEEQLVLIGGLFVLISIPISVRLIYQHLVHFNRPNLQKPIIRILWMVPIYALNAWLALVLPSWTIYLDSIRECYEAYVIYNFMVYLLEALCMEMDLHAVMREKTQVKHFFPFCYMRDWDMGSEFVYKCKHGILQYAFFQPMITVISVICELCGVYGKGTIGVGVAYPYLVIVTNISQTVAMYCLILFYKANKNDMNSMRPFPKFLCIKAVIFLSYFQGMIINLLVYLKVIKNIFGTNEQDDYQVLSEKLQNFLLCLEMILAAGAHHYSYPYQEHQINIPNYRGSNNIRQLLGSMFDVNDIMQDVREHMGAVKNSLTRPFRSADPFQESKTLLASNSGGGGGFSGSSSKFGSRSGSTQFLNDTSRVSVAGPSRRYGTVDYMTNSNFNPTIPIVPQQNQMHSSQHQHHHYHQGAPPPQSPPTSQYGNIFRTREQRDREGAASSSRMLDSPVTTTTTSSNTTQTFKKSDSNNTNSWPSNSISVDDVINIEVKGLEDNLIQLPRTPPL